MAYFRRGLVTDGAVSRCLVALPHNTTPPAETKVISKREPGAGLLGYSRLADVKTNAALSLLFSVVRFLEGRLQLAQGDSLGIAIEVQTERVLPVFGPSMVTSAGC